jgi:hypothetical protein
MAKWMLWMEARDEAHLLSQSETKKILGGEHRRGDPATRMATGKDWRELRDSNPRPPA